MSNNPPCSFLIISLFFVASFIIQIQSASTPVTWVSNSYFVSGKFTYTPPATGSVYQLVTIPYGSALSGSPTRSVALGIVDYEFKYSVPYYFFVLVLDSYSQTGVNVQIVCDYATDLVTFVVSYLTVDPSFTYPFSISYFTTSSSPAAVGPLSLMYYINFTASTGVILDLTHQNGMLAFQHIMDLSSTDYCYQVDIVFRIFNSSFYEVVITSNCTTMSLYQFGFSRIIFDKTAIEALGYCYFQFGQLVATNGVNTPLTLTTSPFFANNFMLGMKSFSLKLTRFKFKCNIGTTTTVNNTDTYKYLSFMYWSFRWRVCPTGYPYFSALTGLCYDACPAGYYPNVTVQLCQPCSYSCTTCSSYSVCTNCDPITNRYLNGTSCLPSSGYFDNGTINAVKCTTVLSNCLNCTNNVTCTSCSSGFYVNLANNTCSACIINCIQCTDSVSCITCGPTYFYNSISNTCVTCPTLIPNCLTCSSTSPTTCTTCATPYKPDSTGTSCILIVCTDPNCVQCFASQSVCQICTSGFNITSSFTCATVCGDGIRAGTEGCDDGDNADGDGCNADCTIGNNNGCPASSPYKDPITNLCTSTCPTGFFSDPTVYACQPCLYSCLTCSTNSTCDTCSSANNRTLVGTDCVPLPGFYDNFTADAKPCVSPCLQCTSATSCTTCVVGNYLSGTSCLACSTSITFCAQCTADGLTCTACQLGYVVNATTGTCSPVPCTDPNCVQCFASQSVCQICTSGFNITSSFTCATVCGDGIKAGTEGCDDGNNADGDGCNADCTIGNNNGCPASSPYKDPITNLCTSTCPTGFFSDPTVYACQPCLYSCLTCSTNSTCDTCSSANNRTLVGTDCVPLPGFYDNFTADAKPCVSPCLQCTSATSCTTCVVGNYLSGTSCLACSTSITFCAQCTADGLTCTACQLGYRVNSTTGACDIIPCYDLNCLLCPNSMSFCTQCTQGYQSVNGVCQTVCGDFIKVVNQQCDDGNSLSKDGCSDTCTIQSQFTCEPHPNNTLGSSCFYIGTVTVDVKYIQKIDDQNKIKIVLDLSPNDLTFWDTVDFLSMISMQSPVPISGVEIIKNPDGTVDIIFQYESDIQGKQINITVNPANSGLSELSRAVPSSNAIIIDPNDNQGAYFYDDNTYKTASVVAALSTGVAGVALGFFILGIISGKMVGVEMMAVVQISFFSLMTLSQLNPCFAALSSLKLVNGYNSLSKNRLEDPLNPIQPKGIFLFSRFVENFNFTTAIILIPLIIALITFILSKTACKENKRVQTIFKKSVGEYTLMGLLFCGYIISVSFALEIMYGVKNTTDLVGKISLAQCSILLLMIIGYFVFLLLKPEYFGEFTQSFKKDKVSSKYYNFMLIERVLLGGCLVVMLPIAMEGAVPSAVFLLTGIFVIVKKPYQENYHNYRVVANMSISLIVEVIYLFYKITSPQERNKPIFIYLPVIVCILLLVCVLYNAAAIVYSIYKYFKNEKEATDLEKQERDQIAKFRNESIVTTGSPDSLKTGVPLNEQSANPLNLRKDIDFKNIKKQIAKINTTINEPGLANSLMLFKDNPINQEDILEYDAI